MEVPQLCTLPIQLIETLVRIDQEPHFWGRNYFAWAAFWMLGDGLFRNFQVS